MSEIPSGKYFSQPPAASAVVLPPTENEVDLGAGVTGEQYYEHYPSTYTPNHLSPNDPSAEASVAYTLPSVQSAPLTALSRTKSEVLLRSQRTHLEQLGFPLGLAEELGKTRSLYPVRFWIVDNSGSMMQNDGTSLRGGGNPVPCTRWSELQECVQYHASLAGTLQATTIFRMLNDPGVRCGPQEFSVAETDNSKAVVDDVRGAHRMMQVCKPSGSTPLTAHVVEIGQRIHLMAEEMKRKGLEAVVVIATDGLPTASDGLTSYEVQQQFIAALRQLQNLPVWIVIRLCTDEQGVVEFYNELDSILEMPLEVLDDFFGEAREIYQHNRWLNYGIPLHRCREMGYQHRIFDLLDERPLNKDEVREFCSILFGSDDFIKPPSVHEEWDAFLRYVVDSQKGLQLQYNPITKKAAPWIDTKELKRAFTGGVMGMFRRKSSKKAL